MVRPLASLLLGLVLTVGVAGASPLVKFANSFGKHMVLQREPQSAKVWGTVENLGPADGVVTVTLSTTADSPVAVVNASVDSTSGEWVATLPPMKGGTTPFIVQAQLVTPAMSESVSFDDTLFGDVYLASGQSNMAFLVQNAFNGSALVQDANNWPHIRLYTSKKLSSSTPLSQQPEIEEPWSVASNISISMNNAPENRRRLDDNWLYMSAVAWLFARRVHRVANVPVGILNTNWGGSPIEFWSSKDAMDACAPPRTPLAGTEYNVSGAWNGMIHPLLHTSLRGVIWYQGEANTAEPTLYTCRFPAMIDDWRKQFNQPDMPFGFVQLASYVGGPDIADLRWAQTAGYGYVPNDKMPNTFMSLGVDLGDRSSPYGSVHSRHKQEIGSRLGDAALSSIYKIDRSRVRPLLGRVEHRDSSITISFTGVEKIAVRNATVGWEICDENGHKCIPGSVSYLNSTAIQLRSSGSTHLPPLMVRYLWSGFPCELLQCSVYGPGSENDALPLAPFKLQVKA